MPTVRLLCLAYSAKLTGRCVAGIRMDTGEWVRPVSPAEDGTLTTAMCMLDVGRPVRALDVFDVKLAKPRPEMHQPENWVIGTGEWRLVEELTLDEASEHLDEILEPGPDLLGSRREGIDVPWIEAHGVEASLALVRVAGPRFERSTWNPNRLRAGFLLRNAYYDLSISDLAPWVGDLLRRSPISPETDWYFTVSLTEPFEKTNRCHKLIAGGIEIAR